ncbi:MAG TPA: methyl-accepting chemotaxis protein [Bryobacteraceae bacterium]|nr:methyl-accepting chemotaxis protein [Bryobacteraceae bacterium]
MRETKISTKLQTALGGLLLVGVAIAVAGIWYQHELGGELDLTIHKTAVKLDLVNGMRAEAWRMIAAHRGAYMFSLMKNQEKVDQNAREWEAARKQMDQLFAGIRPLLVTEAGQRLLARMEAGVSTYDPMAREVMRFASEGKSDEVVPLTAKVAAVANEINDTAAEFQTQQLDLLKNADANSQASQAQSLTVSIGLTCVLLALGAVVVFVVRQINQHLKQAIGELTSGAGQVANAAGQVASASQSLAQGASEQAASLEETSASTEEISSMAHKNSDNSANAAGLVTGAQEKFNQTNRSLDQMVTAMQEINASSDKIAKIIKVIDEIAFQTNILALNAAVEAARAGEAGMGFAVVADEVRNLAQRSAQAARDTAALIEESIAKSNEGKAKVDQVAVAIREITQEQGQVKVLVDEVSMGSQEQARGLEQIAKAITQMERVTQQTAASAEESASAATELTAQSESVKEVLNRLTRMVGGESAPSRNAQNSFGRTPVPAFAAPAVRPSKSDFPMDDES